MTNDREQSIARLAEAAQIPLETSASGRTSGASKVFALEELLT
jgi:hypothetical protein